MRSALAQTHPDIEVVIVDDGSTDADTLELLRRCPWPRTRVLYQENAGPAAARNHGITASSGRYILPLDADDLIDPSYVAKAAAVLDSAGEVGIVYCKANRFGAENGPWQLPPYTLRELVIDNVIFVTSLFRREDWERVGGFSESLRRGVEDYDFWVKIVAVGPGSPPAGRISVPLPRRPCFPYHRVQRRPGRGRRHVCRDFPEQPGILRSQRRDTVRAPVRPA